MKQQVLFACLLPSLLISHFAVAKNFEFVGELGIETEYSNNAFLSADDEVSEVERSAVAELTLEGELPWLITDFGYRAERSSFLHDRFHGETVVEGEADLTAIFSPQRFSWNIHSERRESRVGSRLVDIRSNREIRNILSTGPTFVARLSPVDNVVTDLRYFDVSFKENNNEDVSSIVAGSLNSERSSASLSWQHRLSLTNNLGLNLNATDVEFDQDLQEGQLSSDYKDQGAFFYFESELARLDYRLELGFSAIEREDSEDIDSETYHLSWQYNNEPWSHGGELLKQLTDSSIGLANTEFNITDFDPVDSNSDTQDIVTQQTASLFVTWASGRHRVRLQVTRNDEDFDETPRDEIRTVLNLDWTKQLQRNLSSTVSMVREHIELLEENPEQTIDNNILRVSLSCRVSQSVNIQAAAEMQRRDNDFDVGREYENWQTFFALRYLF